MNFQNCSNLKRCPPQRVHEAVLENKYLLTSENVTEKHRKIKDEGI